MFARKVAVRLKPNSLHQFASLMDREVLPWLRTQPGFLDLILLAASDGSEVATISFWDQEGDAQAYNASGYPAALKVLEGLLDGKPYVKTFEVVSSTLQKISPAQPAGGEIAEEENAKPTTPTGDTGPIQLAYPAYETRA
jgi:heme-degrading monooxygenase HmoA